MLVFVQKHDFIAHILIVCKKKTVHLGKFACIIRFVLVEVKKLPPFKKFVLIVASSKISLSYTAAVKNSPTR